MINIYTEERLRDEAAKSAARIREIVCAAKVRLSVDSQQDCFGAMRFFSYA